MLYIREWTLTGVFPFAGPNPISNLNDGESKVDAQGQAEDQSTESKSEAGEKVLGQEAGEGEKEKKGSTDF